MPEGYSSRDEVLNKKKHEPGTSERVLEIKEIGGVLGGEVKTIERNGGREFCQYIMISTTPLPGKEKEEIKMFSLKKKKNGLGMG
ncbi:hypothetical protein CDAR_254451 [Caerostris darwini]|uniref:Uncharacterized protein n=1 Tax=Caerostris darwini TaxID=1538125 RepID=A0AAV4UB42_9ARAC|nr:hypothetical protein CDAR_254451 [Caerostris darwini]